jgi:hypothetical protein
LPKPRPVPTGKPVGTNRDIGRATGRESDCIGPITVVTDARSPEASP